jgi:sulfite reductase (NADPH) hemoprotein beta-component
MLSSVQMRKLAFIADQYDKGYAHLTTRQNIQFNWPALADVPDILANLAQVEMHAIQTSGNCIRNTTTDQFAGVSADEVEDARAYCEIIRQWSTFHPEFAFLPRKFKIAVCGTRRDQAATQVHDIGLYLLKNEKGEIGFRVLVGGGLGRTPVIGSEINSFLPQEHLLTYLDAILRVYNREGRRDNKYKARIKILVKETGAGEFREKVQAEWQPLKDGPMTLIQAEIERCRAFFHDPAYKNLPGSSAILESALNRDLLFASWYEQNIALHKKPGYAIVTICVKKTGFAPGDLDSDQMRFIADISDRYSFGEMRITHTQNLVLADVEKDQLYDLWQALKVHDLEADNLGLLSDMICCPGGDFCSLANAKSIPIAESIQRRFSYAQLREIGQVSLNISGCMNACGHHHVGNIGILGVDKKGEEYYQISLGGSADNNTALGKIVGPSFSQDEVPDVIEKIVHVYQLHRDAGENFLAAYNRIGMDPFKEALYGSKTDGKQAD